MPTIVGHPTTGRCCGWAPGGVYTSWFQFSKTQGGVLPTHFGDRYQDDLKRAARIAPLLHANVTGIRLSADARQVDHLDIATLSGNRFTVKPRYHGAGGGRDGECAAVAGVQ